MSVEDYLRRGYKRGMVLRVHMHNFLTYDDAEVFPGPCLNIVLGPNGTGKSTLTHAICLACGGSPSTVGRSPNLSQFVKRGKEGQEAFTEVDLLGSDSIFTIRRTITSENKTSKWHLNQKISTQAAVADVMRELKIDMENLCSFMPQDKVGNFTLQTPQGVLQKTLQCITGSNASMTLAQEQAQLADNEARVSNHKRELEAKEEKASVLQRQVDGMKLEVERMRARADKQELLDMYKTKEVVLIATQSVGYQQECQTAVEEATRLFVDAKNRLEPLESRERELKMQQTQRDKEASKAALKVNDALKAVDTLKTSLEDNDVALEKNLADIESVEKERNKKLAALNTLKNSIRTTEEKLALVVERLPEVNKKLEGLTREVSVREENKGRALDELNDLKTEERGFHDRLGHLTEELTSMKDPLVIFKNKIQGHQDVVEAMQWLKTNQERFLAEGQLRHPVIGPVATACNVKDPACAAMLEKLGYYSYMNFLCECNEDMKFLQRELRDKKKLFKLDFTVIEHVDIDPPMYSPAFLENAKRTMGIQGYLMDQLECPDTVRAFLCSFHGLRNVLWAKGTNLVDKLTEPMLDSLGIGNRHYRLFVQNFTRGQEYTTHEINGSKSRYNQSGDFIRSFLPIGAASFLGPMDADMSSRKAELEAEKNSLTQRRNTNATAQKTKRDAIAKLDQEIEKLKNDRSACKVAQGEPTKLQVALKRDKERERDLNKALSSDVDKDKRELLDVYSGLVRDALKLLKETVTKSRGYINCQIDKDVADANKRTLSNALYQASQAVREGKQMMEELQKDVNMKTRRRDEAQKRVETAEESLKALEVEKGGPARFDAFYARVLLRCPEDSLAEVELKMDELAEELANIVENREILRRYEASQKELAETLDALEQLQTDYENDHKDTATQTGVWVEAVDMVARRLDASFNKFMAALQYKGAVCFNQVGTILDYELIMKVAFRDNSDPANLSGQKHSGGERAVSTIMFLMALQSMTSAPFRIVDEINQGMDERNERLVFDRIVQSCCGEAAKSQYFLISPKLLQGLRSMDNDDVTVLMIWNGPGVMTKWQLPAIIAALKRKRGIADEEEDEPFIARKAVKNER